MSALDIFDEERGESGVPMRRRAPSTGPSGAEMVAVAAREIANALVQSQGALTAGLANVLTSRAQPAPEPARNVRFFLSKDAAGRIVAGTASTGDVTWRLEFDRSSDGVAVNVIRI